MNISGPLTAPGCYPLPAASRDTRPASAEAQATDAQRRRQAAVPRERVMQGELLQGGRGRQSSGVFERTRLLDGYTQRGTSPHLARHALDQYRENSQTPRAGAEPFGLGGHSGEGEQN